ncbi:hypothetical protein [Kribbella deserti]|uniref:WD40 repeat domain-containing protein n=1 Tax=Kribbella deserti TaxID=1926257 RepID=A0ABV6QJ08_9ACTN
MLRLTLAGVLATATAIAVPAAAVQPAPAYAAQASTTAAAQLAAISCSTATGSSDFYDGPSASKVYDAKFSSAPAIAQLSTHTPQGAGTWFNWDGAGKHLLLVTSYRTGSRSLIIGINPSTGKTVGIVAIAASHVGGITVSNGWAFVSGTNSGSNGTIRKYRLSELRTAMKKAGTPYLKQVGSARVVYGSSFISSYGGYLWSGRFQEKTRGKMYQYKINANGSLTTINRAWEIPTKTQGLLVAKNHFIFSTSYGRSNRSNVYVVRRGQPDLDRARLKCFRAPSMSEGLTEFGGRAYLVFESGSHLYRSDSRTLNVIPRMHKTPLSALTSMV